MWNMNMAGHTFSGTDHNIYFEDTFFLEMSFICFATWLAASYVMA